MTKLKYIIDQKYDAYKIYEMLMEQDFSVVKYQSEWMEIDFNFAQKIAQSSEYSAVKSRIERIVEERYKILLSYMEKTLIGYQNSWDEINNNFFKRLTDLTTYQLQHKTFYC